MKLRWSFRAANDRAQQSESQVPSLGPFIEKYLLKSKCFFYWPIGPESRVRDQVSKSTAASGGRRETEKKKNKEYHEALQASETTIFFLVAMASRSRLPPRSVLLCFAQRCPQDTRTPSLGPFIEKYLLKSKCFLYTKKTPEMGVFFIVLIHSWR